MDRRDLITVEEAAVRLGVSVATIRRYCATGKLKAQKTGRAWLVEESSLPSGRAGSRRRSVPRASQLVDLGRALQHLQSTDLAEVWVPDPVRFEDELADPVNLFAGAAARIDGVEAFDPRVDAVHPKSSFFFRSAALLSLPDRLSYQAVVGELAPRIDGQLRPSVYSARLSREERYFVGKGPAQWVRFRNAVVKSIEEGWSWMMKTDITSFFDFIQHRLLFMQLEALSIDNRLIATLRQMLRAWATVPDCGLPQGPNASRVLANLYLSGIDEIMESAPGCLYFRYMDDIRIVGRRRSDVINAIRILDLETKKQALALSAQKTHFLQGQKAIDDFEDAQLNQAQYVFEWGGDDDELRKQLRRIFRGALSGDEVVMRRARFSLWRLYRLRDRGVRHGVLNNLERLAPLGQILPAYLAPWLTNPRVQRSLADFLEDEERNTSAFLSTWLLAGMLEVPAHLPPAWVAYARTVAQDRNEAPYHRGVAANVMSLGGTPGDIAWLREAILREFDPAIVRAFAIALARADKLDRATLRVVSRTAGMEPLLNYLAGRNDFPSLIFPGRYVRLR